MSLEVWGRFERIETTMKTPNLIRRIKKLAVLALAGVLVGCGGGGDDFDFDTPNNPLPPSGNNPPPLIAYFDSYEGEVDTILQVDELFGVLSNDEYPVFATTIEYPFETVNGGDLEGYQDGGFEYEPPAGFTGQDSFVYTLVDNEGRESSATVFITVYPANFRRVD